MTLPPGDHADYSPIFIGQILETVGGHFDRHQSSHADLHAHLASIEQKVDRLMADLATLVADFDKFAADVKDHLAKQDMAMTAIEAANTDLKTQLAAAQAAGTVTPDVQAAVDHMESTIADARTVLDAAPVAPVVPPAPAQPSS